MLLQASAQVCVDVLCNDNDDAPVADEGPAPPPVHEPEAPAWVPGPGGCDIEHDGDDVKMACADGTRALFTGGRAGAPTLEEHSRPADDGACPGGAVLRQGVDLDGNGRLAAIEVTGRTVDCPDEDGVRAPTLVGHLAIQGPDDIARLAGRRALTGGLLVKSDTLVRLELPELQSVGGTLRVEGAPALEVLALPHLTAVGGDVVVARAARLAEVRVPALKRVGGSVVVVDNPRLSEAYVEDLVFRLTRHGFVGPVDLAGNAPQPTGTAPPAP